MVIIQMIMNHKLILRQNFSEVQGYLLLSFHSDHLYNNLLEPIKEQET